MLSPKADDAWRFRDLTGHLNHCDLCRNHFMNRDVQIEI